MDFQRNLQLLEFVETGSTSKVRNWLLDDPNLDVNWKSGASEPTYLQIACRKGHLDIVELLLRHPAIELNQESENCTAFYWACYEGQETCVRRLLKDLRVTLSNQNRTPIRMAAFFGHIPVIKWMIASGRDLDQVPLAIKVAREKFNQKETQSSLENRQDNCTVVAQLLTRYQREEDLVRREIREELGITGNDKVQIFPIAIREK